MAGPRAYGPREQQLNVRLDEKTHKALALLCSYHGETKSQLIARLIDQASQVAKAEVAARPPFALPSPDEIDADEQDAEAFRRLKGPIDHIR